MKCVAQISTQGQGLGEAHTYIVVVLGYQKNISWQEYEDFCFLKDYSDDVIVDDWRRVRLETENQIRQEVMVS